MGRELVAREESVDLIVSSSAVRALSTATLVAKELEYDVDKIDIEEDIYKADKRELLVVIKNIPNQFDKVLILGHNPTITDLVNMLSPELIPDIPTAGIVALRFACATWREISRDNAALHFFDFPKNHNS
jgi:phosphohistidine phosphatase